MVLKVGVIAPQGALRALRGALGAFGGIGDIGSFKMPQTRLLYLNSLQSYDNYVMLYV